MLMQIRRYQVDPEVADDLTKRATESLAPLLRRLPGLLDYYVVNSHSGTVFSVTICEDKACLEEARRQAMEWTRQHAAAQLPNPPEIIEGEVVTTSDIGVEKEAA